MQESTQQLELFPISKTSGETCYTSRTEWADNTFCRGGCDEIERLEDACQACKIEYHEYWEQRNNE